jgi:hypothetical protein
MERIDDQATFDLLRRANERFGSFFTRFSGAPVEGSDEEVEALLQVEQAMRSVGLFLDGSLQKNEAPAVREELARYRANLVRLQQELAGMQESAFACRARVANQRNHLRAAKEWCEASRTTT